MTTKFVPGLVCAFLVAGACSSMGRSAAPDRIEPRLRSADACVLESAPAELPPSSAFLDEGSLQQSIRDLRASDYAREGEVVLTLEFQADGLNIRREVIEQTVGAPAADSIQKLVFAHLRQPPEEAQPWGVRLGIEVQAEDVALQVERRQYCPPRARNREIDAARWEYFSTGSRIRQGVRERTVIVRLAIHPGGFVAGGQLLRGDTPGGTLERDLITFLRRYSFQPATIDGFPAYGTIDVPVRVRGR